MDNMDTIRRIRGMLSIGVDVVEIHDRLIASGLTEEMAFLCYVAAHILDKDSRRRAGVA